MEAIKNEKLKEVVSLLKGGQEKNKGSFSVEQSFEPSQIKINVEGLGDISLPLEKETILKLIQISSDAKFGLREKTLLDKKVRDTQEISSHKLKIDIDEKSLKLILSKIRKGLGFPKDAQITLDLHNMLIYGPGQFFEQHQDSEKLDGMVATLVMALPFPHIGGDLVIEHNGEEDIFSSENIDSNLVECVAFYADCKHQVKKVTAGYRVALTYNIVLKSKKFVSDTLVNPKLQKAVSEYFSPQEIPEHIKLDTLNPESIKLDKLKSEPLKLIYFLDHEYTEKSLRWDLLKGKDLYNVKSFRSLAKDLDLVSHLALAQIHGTWEVEGNYDEEEDDSSDIHDLLDHEISLSYWIDHDNQKLDFKEYDVFDNEACWTKETEEFDPYESEYERYAGNYGNTLDRWYRRAAIVLWRESDSIITNFQLNFNQAKQDLVDLTKVPEQEEKIIEIIQKAGKYFYQDLSEKKKEDFLDFSNICLYIKDKEISQSILAHFDWLILDVGIEQRLYELKELYGIDWVFDLMRSWKDKTANRYRYTYATELKIDDIDVLCHKFKETVPLVEFLISSQIEYILGRDQYFKREPNFLALKKSLPKIQKHITSTLLSCLLISEFSFIDKIINHIVSDDFLYPTFALADIFLELTKKVSSEDMKYFEVLKDHLHKNIIKELEIGLQPEDDWSISGKLYCECSYCETATSFLRSKTEKSIKWPIAQKIRTHICDKFRNLDLPVKFAEERTGSPYKLIMEKTPLLHVKLKDKFLKLNKYSQKLGINPELSKVVLQ